MRIDQSMLSKYLFCQRAYYWRYQLDLTLLETPAYFKDGKIIHTAINSIHSGLPLEEVIEGAYEVSDPELLKTIEGFFKYNPFPVFEELKQEVLIEKKVSTNYLVGRADGIMSTKGKKYLVEYKTAKSITQNYIESYYNSFQLITYSLLSEINDIFLVLLPKTGKERIPVSHIFQISDKQIYNYKLMFISLMKELKSKVRKENFICNLSSCGGNFPVFKRCEYFPLCNSNGITQKILLSANYKTEKWIAGGDDKK